VAQFILKELQARNYTAYLAGGCVRDAFLGRKAKDLDIATNAKAEDLMELFPDNVPVGEQFGVIIVKYQKQGLEVATFRKDGIYKDGRRPEFIEYSSPKEDALRRDFTINALFYDIQSQKVIDYVNGLNDIKRKVIRAVGDPKKRLTEDKLRVLRAIRFATEINFNIEENLFKELKVYSSQIHQISKERITAELKQILSSKQASKGLRLLRDLHCLQAILPDFTFLNSDKEFNDFIKKFLIQSLFECFLCTYHSYELTPEIIIR